MVGTAHSLRLLRLELAQVGAILVLVHERGA